jgi:hypothetical protein
LPGTSRSTLFAGNVVSEQVCRVLLVVVALGLWELGADRVFDSFFFNTPSRILRQVFNELIDPGFYTNLGVTRFQTIAGFAIGAVGGIMLGVLLARSDFVNKVLDPFLLSLYAIPRIALAPMLIVWFGISYASKSLLGATPVFFITFVNTAATSSSPAWGRSTQRRAAASTPHRRPGPPNADQCEAHARVSFDGAGGAHPRRSGRYQRRGRDGPSVPRVLSERSTGAHHPVDAAPLRQRLRD